MNRNRTAPAQPQTVNQENIDLRNEVAELELENSQLREDSKKAGIWGTIFMIAFFAALVALFFSGTAVTNLTAERDAAQDNANDYMFDNLILEKKLRLYEREDEFEARARVEALQRAQMECERQVSESMATVTVDTFGNPVDVSEFAHESCTSELRKSGETKFVERFRPAS